MVVLADAGRGRRQIHVDVTGRLAPNGASVRVPSQKGINLWLIIRKW